MTDGRKGRVRQGWVAWLGWSVWLVEWVGGRAGGSGGWGVCGGEVGWGRCVVGEEGEEEEGSVGCVVIYPGCRVRVRVRLCVV